MYQPALLPEQVKALFYLKKKMNRPMTHLLREALERYLDEHGGCEALVPENERPTGRDWQPGKSRRLRTLWPQGRACGFGAWWI